MTGMFLHEILNLQKILVSFVSFRYWKYGATYGNVIPLTSPVGSLARLARLSFPRYPYTQSSMGVTRRSFPDSPYWSFQKTCERNTIYLHTWYLRGILTLWGLPSAQTLRVCWSTLKGGSPASPSSPPSISWNRDLEMCIGDILRCSRDSFGCWVDNINLFRGQYGMLTGQYEVFFFIENKIILCRIWFILGIIWSLTRWLWRHWQDLSSQLLAPIIIAAFDSKWSKKH